LIFSYLLTSFSINANPYYQAIHCFDERVNNPQEGDIARCLVGGNGKYMCPINSVACSIDSDVKISSPVCSQGTLNSSGQCVFDVCYYKLNADTDTRVWNETPDGSMVVFDGFYGTHMFTNGPVPSYLYRGRYRQTDSIFTRYEVCKRDAGISNPVCPSGQTYNSATKLCEERITKNVCPLGGQYECIPNGGASYCSPNTCFDPNAEKDVTDDQIDGSMLQNNGATDDAGMCLDKVYIFSGRAQKCRPNGVQTAFKDCCATDEKVLKDSSGSSAQTEAYTQSINAIYQASSAAYTAYAAGATAAEASSAFGSAFVGAFDPTSLAIAIAIAIIMDYLAKACDQIETETAIANSSGRCVELGEMCKEKWFGKCVQNQKSFCCFNSQLAKIINEQGRLQLKAFQNLPNGGFGNVENPQCRGFTPEEFQALDFSNIDLTEYYEELIHKSQSEIESTMEQMTAEHFQNVK